MAKTKSIKSAPMRNGSGTDQTFLTECRAVLAFNNACNAEIVINTETKAATITLHDYVAGATYTGTVELQEAE